MAAFSTTFIIFYVYCLSSFISIAFGQADCRSYGVDFFDGGGPYFINSASADDFSFTTVFQGCTGESVTPLLIAPNTDEFFCSDIQTTPNGQNMVSVCNVNGNEVSKSSMISGTYTIVIEGLDFAWMRTFEITTGVQSTVTATPTAVFNITATPVVNTTTTITQEYEITLFALTTTVPSVTKTAVSTITPSQVTTTSTNTKIVTRASRSLTVTIITKTKTISCDTRPPKTDPTCTVHPKKLTASKATSQASSRLTSRTKLRQNVTPDRKAAPRKGQRSMSLERRDADIPTTTIFETTYTATSFNTFTASPSTDTYSTFTTTTNTITPPPVTVASGITQITSTITLPTQTRVITTQTIVTSTLTKVLTATITLTTVVLPANGACTKI